MFGEEVITIAGSKTGSPATVKSTGALTIGMERPEGIVADKGRLLVTDRSGGRLIELMPSATAAKCIDAKP